MDANAACIINFETKAQRKLKMVLWYEVMNDAFPYSYWVTQKLINEAFVAYNTNNPNPSQFIIELGTQISNMTAEQIAMGDGDSIATIWFTQCRDSNFPTFIRLLSEMNHPGTYANDPENTGANKWGGTPTTYIQAWRRWYNIAERLNATGNKQVFVWSPHAKEDYRYHSSSPQRNMENYYPGHQYVDWVGASVYNNDSTAIVSVYDQLTRISALYGSVKPLMISEGAMQETNQADEKYNFILDWWNAINLLDIKAAVWFNDKPVGTTQEFKIDSSPASLRAYRPYLIPR
jgi:beta-mannanase